MLQANQSVADNLKVLRERIAEAALKAGRQPDEITLVGVSKTQPAEAIIEALGAGLVHFGENRVQEAQLKIPRVKRDAGSARAVFHMVGHLQTNKAGSAVGLFDCVDSVDSLRLAQALGHRVELERRAELPVRLEVYVGDDARRPGLRPDQLVEVAGQILEVRGLRIEGLMTLAPLDGDARAAFGQVRALKHRLAETFPRVHFGVLSMGMSEDFGLAIEQGSTEVRIGTALFGPRRNSTSP